MPHQLIYSSEAATPLQSDDLEELLAHARRGNAARGITGALVYADGVFLQVLEGDKDPVQALMARIRRDVRHENVVVLQEGDVPAAMFGSWKMAYVSATRQQVARWAGFRVAHDTTESLSEAAGERERTAQFAQDILALLGPQDMPRGKVE